MSDNEKYPEWGTFGLPAERTEHQTHVRAPCPHGEDGEGGENAVSDGNITIHLSYSVAPDGTQTVSIGPDDTENDKQRALDWAKLEGLRAKLNSPDGQRFRLSGKRDALTAVIEMARCSAARLDDLHSVWAALEWLALRQVPPLLGLSDDGGNIAYRDGGKIEEFTKPQLRRRLERQ